MRYTAVVLLVSDSHRRSIAQSIARKHCPMLCQETSLGASFRPAQCGSEDSSDTRFAFHVFVWTFASHATPGPEFSVQRVVKDSNESSTSGSRCDPMLCQEPLVVRIIPTRSVWLSEAMRPTRCSPCSSLTGSSEVCRELCLCEQPGFVYTRIQQPPCRNMKKQINFAICLQRVTLVETSEPNITDVDVARTKPCVMISRWS